MELIEIYLIFVAHIYLFLIQTKLLFRHQRIKQTSYALISPDIQENKVSTIKFIPFTKLNRTFVSLTFLPSSMTNSRKILSIVSSLHSLSLYLFISKLESDDSIYFSFWEISFLIIGTNLCNLCRFLLCYDSLRLFHFSFQYWN